MYGNNDPNELLICPYDPVHRVAAKTFPYHLKKCREVGDENMAASRSNESLQQHEDLLSVIPALKVIYFFQKR